MEITAIVISGIAALISLSALIISIYHKHLDNRRCFYSKMEEKISEILFINLPNSLSSFLDLNGRKINNENYDSIDECFSELYNIIRCLDFLDDDVFSTIKEAISDLEDTLMYLKNDGYDNDKIELAFKKNKVLYKTMKSFALKH